MKSLDFEEHSFLGVETLKPTSVTQSHCQTRSMGLRLLAHGPGVILTPRWDRVKRKRYSLGGQTTGLALNILEDTARAYPRDVQVSSPIQTLME